MTPPVRVLFLRSNPVAPDPRVEKEAHTLSTAGYSVRVLGWDRTGLLPSRESRPTWEILRLAIPAGPGRGLGNLPGLLRWQWGLWRWLLRHRREMDLIHACDLDTVLPALLARLLWGSRVIYDIFDFFADMLRQTPPMVVRLVRWLELRVIESADAVILADRARLAQVAPSQPRRLAFIYNCLSDLPLEDPLPPPAGTALSISYVGNLQVERGLLQLLAVVARNPAFHLHLAGFGPDQALILQQALPLPNVTWHGQVPYPQALRLNRSADVLVATYDPSIPNHRFSSPNKVFEAMLLARPVIVARGTNMDLLIAQESCGLVVPYGDEPALEAALLRLQDDPAYRRLLGGNARAAFEREYRWERMESHLLALYAGVLSECA